MDELQKIFKGEGIGGEYEDFKKLFVNDEKNQREFYDDLRKEQKTDLGYDQFKSKYFTFTPVPEGEKKKATPDQGVGSPVSQPQSKTASVVTPQSKPAVSPAKPTYLYGQEKEVVTPAAGENTPVPGLGGAPMEVKTTTVVEPLSPLQKEQEQATGMKEMFQKFQNYRNQATIAAQKNTLAAMAGEQEAVQKQREANPERYFGLSEQEKAKVIASEDERARVTREKVATQPLTMTMLDYYKRETDENEGTTIGDRLNLTDGQTRDDRALSQVRLALDGTPLGAEVENRLQKIYQRTNLKDKNSVDNSLLDAKQVFFDLVGDKDTQVWDDFAQTNKAMADYNPQAYHKRIEGQIEKKYAMAGMDKDVAYKKLLDYSLDRGVMDEERTAEAKAVMNLRNIRDEVSRAEREGSAFRIDQAKQKLAAAEKEVQAMESKRLSSLDKRIEIIQGLIVNEPNQEKAALLKKDLDLAKAQRAGFINPNAKVMATYAKYQDQADAVAPQGTPAEKLQKLYAELEFDRQQIMGRIQQAEAKGGALGFAANEMINSLGGEGHNDDHRRLMQIEAQIKDLAPIVYLNENPVVQDKKAGFFPAFNTGFMNSLAGEGSPMSNTQRQEDALALARNLQIAGVSPEALNEPTMLGVKDRMEEPGFFSGEYLGGLSGQSTGLMASIMAATALTRGVGLSTAIGRAVQLGNKTLGLTGKYSGAILPLLGDALESGINYETAGRISVDNNDELDFVGGFLGGAASSVGSAGFNSLKSSVAKFFGDKAQDAVKLITNFGASRVGAGVGETAEEFGQQIGQTWEASSTGQEFWKRMEDQFGSVDKTTKFIASTMIMGAFMGGAHSGGLGEYLTNYAQEQLEALPPEQREMAQPIVDQIQDEQAAFVEGGLNSTPEDVASVEAEQEGIEPEKKRELKPEAQAAQAELERRAAIDKTMVEQGLGDRVNTAQSQEDRLREERDSLVAQQERQELTDNEKKKLADLETVVTGLDQIAAGEQFVSPAPEVQAETVTTNSGDVIEAVEGSPTKKKVTLESGIDLEIDTDGLSELLGDGAQSVIEQSFAPTEEGVAVEETPASPTAEENPFGDPTPREQPKRRDQQIVEQIDEFFNGLAGAVSEGSKEQLKKYATRILAGEDPTKVMQGQSARSIELVNEVIKQIQQESAPATDKSIVDVTGEAPTPIAAEETVVADSPRFENMDDAQVERRMSELEVSRNPADQKEFNALEKEMAQREMASVFDVALEDVDAALQVLEDKEKTMPNGFGPAIEMQDIRQTREVAEAYLDAEELSDADVLEDFKEALLGNPDTWYADRLKLRESSKEAARRGISTQALFDSVVAEFVKDGFSQEDAAQTIKQRMESISAVSKRKMTPPVTQKKGKGAANGGKSKPKANPNRRTKSKPVADLTPTEVVSEAIAVSAEVDENPTTENKEREAQIEERIENNVVSPAPEIPKEISDLYAEAATLRFTVNALGMQMGGKTLVGKAKAEFDRTSERLAAVEKKLSEYESSKKEKPVEQAPKKEAAKQVSEPAMVDSDYGNYLLEEIEARLRQRDGDEEASKLRAGLAKGFTETVNDRGEARAISNLESIYVEQLDKSVRADAYRAIRDSFARLQEEKAKESPAPKPKKPRGKQQALPEGVEAAFHEATMSGRRTSWVKKDGKWFFRNHKPGTKISEQKFERDWQEATGKDVAKAEKLAAMDPYDLAVLNEGKKWISDFKDFITLKWGMKGAAFSRVDLGLADPIGKIMVQTVKLGVAVAKQLAAKGAYTKANWEEAMKKFAGDHVQPLLSSAWETIQAAFPEGSSIEQIEAVEDHAGKEAEETKPKKKKEPVEDSGEKTGTQKLMEKYISKAGEVLAKVIANSPMLKSVYDQKAQYEKALKEVKEAIAANKVGQLMAKLMEASTTDTVDVDQFQRMILVDMYSSLTDNATEVRNSAAVTGDKAAEKQAQKDIDRFTTNTTSMLNAMNANALGAGRGGAASGMWRFIGGSMDTYAMGVIDKANRAIAKSKKTANGKTLEETSKEIADNLNEEKKKKANEIADSVDGAIDNGVDQSKPKRKSSTIAGKTAAEFAELKRQAKEKYDSIRLGGTMNAILSPNGFAKTAAAAEFGYYALLEGAVTFKDWVASMKKDLPDLTDQELTDIWDSELNGRTLSEESKNVLREKALKSINSALSSSERAAENTDSAKETKKLRDQMAKDLAATIEAGESIDDFKKKYGLTDEQAEDLSESIAKADQSAIDKLAGKKVKGFDPKVYLPKPKGPASTDAQKADAKKKAETRAKVKEVIRDHFANPDGQPLIDKLTEAGLDLEQAQKVEQAVRDNAQVILAQAVAGELDHIQSGESKRKNKDYKPPKKGGKKRTNAEILIDNLVDGNITDRFVQGLVRHKFGMGRTATAEEVTRLRKLGKAVKEAQAGSVFEKMAMKELATLIDPLLPRKKSNDLSALLNGLIMSSVLNSVSTMMVNPYSVTDHWFIGSIKPLGDPQQWADLFNALTKKDGGNPALLNPLAKMLTKMMAGHKPALSGMESFASGMITGTTSGKYDESVMDSDPSKMLPALEREQRTAFGRALTSKKWWNPYSHIFGKTIGRILSATDAGMTMAYGDLEFLDALRVAIGKKPNGSIAELKQLIGEYLSQKSQLWQDSLQQAQDEAAAMEALTGKHVPDITVEVRAREIVRKKFASDPRVMLDESELASIQKVAQYNTLTLKRQGGFGKAAEIMAKLKGGDEKWQKILKGVLWPFILFTEIPGNFGDALLDNTPVYNILRAIGLSPTGIAKRMGWTETSAMLGEPGSRERRKQLEQIFFSNILFLAVFALIGMEDDDDRFVTSKEINSDESYQFFGIPYRAFASLAPAFILARVLRDSEKDPKYKTMDAPEAAYMQVTSAMTALSGFYTDQSFMKGIQDFGRLATTLAEFSKGETTNQAAFRAVIRPYLNLAAKPLPQTQGVTRFILDCFDPHKYTEEDWSEMFAMTIGMERINNEKKIGLFGEEYLVYPGNNVLNVKSLIDWAAGDHPMKKQYEFLARTKTFIKAPTNPVAKFLDPKSSTGFTFREFTPSEWEKLNKKAGDYFLKDLNTYMNSTGEKLGGKIDVANNKLISQTQTDILDKWSKARSKAKKELFGKILLSDTEAQKLIDEKFPDND